MKATRIIPVTLLIVASGLLLHAALAHSGSQRTDLERYDLSVPGREVIQLRVDLDPG